MKLELKHLAPYLPYRLKIDVSYYREEEDDLIEIVSYIDNKLNAFVEYDTNVGAYAMPIIGEFDLYKAKPILRPLSDLTKEIEHNREKFYPYEKLHLCYSDVTNFLSEDLWIGQWLDYEKVTKLLEWHFDVFGLIESGLAININTLKK